ncbi:MAG TPA: S8 family serine peptidase [Gaiellaceae bacterium]|nr:S8 family serine peptidase [Gaiellaceae bacterium]
MFLGTAVGASSAAKTPFTVGAAPTLTSTFSAAKSVTGQLAQTDPSLLGQTSSKTVNVMIKYDVDSAASYVGGVAGYKPTSPSVTGVSLAANQSAVTAYDQHLDQVTSKISSAVDKAVPSTQIGATFTTAYGGVAAQVPANQVGALLNVPGVVAVQKDSLAQPLDDNTEFIGATAVWPSLGGSANAGKHVIVGVIDTGVWPENPMLSPSGISPSPVPLGNFHCDFGNGSDVAHLGPTFACNNKLIGAYNFTQTYMATLGSDGQEFCNNTTLECSVRDSEGHGTHTMTTAAGDCVTSAILYGVDRGPVCGIAPGAHVIEYRACLSQGCFNADTVGAVQQAILNGVDVINYSISGGADPYTDPTELAFLDAFHAGISVEAAAGNSGPAAATVDHGAPWVTSVGAVTGPRSFTSTLHLAADGGATFTMPGVTLTKGITSPTPIVLAQNLPGEDVLCQSKLAAGTATGKVVLCERGVNARIDKGFNVLQGGAAGMIEYNPIAEDTESDNHWLPAIHLDGPDTALLAFIANHTNVTATWAQGAATPATPDVMAAFSSRGPSPDFLKPDVVAPGVQVLAGMTPQPDETTPTNGPPGNNFQAIAGTSMASPHAAGVAALIKSVHPDWDPAEIKSAMMTSAVQDVVNVNGDGTTSPVTPFDDGAGSIRVDRAVNPTAVFDENYNDYVASETDALDRINLNIPSVDETVMTGQVTVPRSLTNVTGKNVTLTVATTTSSPDATILVTDSFNKSVKVKADDVIHLKKNDVTPIWITIEGPDLTNGTQYFGRITLTPQGTGSSDITIPVAFVKQQGSVTLTHTCSPTTITAKKTTSNCNVTVTNEDSIEANASLTVSPTNKDKLEYTNITAPGSSIGTDSGVTWSGALSPTIAPQITSITPTTGPGGGYLPLSDFGVAPIAGVGDETITNFNVPTFYFGGEPYTSIGIVSDGYVVVGGGTQSDVDSEPQKFPDPSAPNDVVAPFMTDLNPAAGGTIRIGTLSDAVANLSWLIVDFEGVKNFSNGVTHTGEIWFQLSSGAATGAASEQTTISYGGPTVGSAPGNAGQGDPDGVSAAFPDGVNWGAENRDGSSGINLATAPADGSEYAVNTSPPSPGGSVSINFTVGSKKPGSFVSRASMTSDVTPGTTQVDVPITVH